MASDTRTAELHERGDWWNFERLTQWDRTHPAAAWAAHLLQEAAAIRLPCPRCSAVASVRTNIDHLLRDHQAGYAEVATWMEQADADLFSLAVHYLASKARASRQAAGGTEAEGPERRGARCSQPIATESTHGRGLLPGWCSKR
ncbi:MAG TPA: hypothetical protein VG602_02875 [Actinomycetota bacterium]|nr:hypothetical protein [Actinomycetota bacterium]